MNNQHRDLLKRSWDVCLANLELFSLLSEKAEATRHQSVTGEWISEFDGAVDDALSSFNESLTCLSTLCGKSLHRPWDFDFVMRCKHQPNIMEI